MQSRYYNPNWGRFINADGQLNDGLLGYNMFAYCGNNSIIFADYNGNDAIVLLDTNSVSHIGLLIEDASHQWWHYYWGTSGVVWKILCLKYPVPAFSWCNPYTGDLTLEAINNSNQFSGDYEDYLYLNGDFSESVEKAKKGIGIYSLYCNNCSQKSLRILSKSDTEYKTSLKRASNYIIPTSAFYYLKIEIEIIKPAKRSLKNIARHIQEKVNKIIGG